MVSMHLGGGGRHGGGRFDPNDDTKPLKITNTRMLKWFYSSLKPYRLWILLSILAMLISTGASLYGPLVIKDVIDKVAIPGNLDPLLNLTFLFLAAVVLSHVFGAARTIAMHVLGYRFMYKVRMQCYRHIMKLGMDYFERQRSGDIMSRISNDVQAVETMVTHGTDDIISKGFHILMAVSILVVIDWKATLVAFAPVPIFVVCIWVFAHYIRPVFRKIRQELGEINVKLQERIGGIRVIKAFARETAETDYFDESSIAYCQAASKSVWMWGTFHPALGVVTSSGMAILLWYCGWKAATGIMSVGSLYVYIRYMQRFYRPIGALAQVQNLFNRALASLARIFELFDEKPSVADKADAVDLGKAQGKVEFKNVNFKYTTGEIVLKDINATAEPGEIVAIVGRSGAGKTTLVNLIPRFYDPHSGSIYIDSHDVRDLSQESLRLNIGMVLQETYLFNASIKENISYARPEAKEEEIIEAAKAAHAHDFITQFEEGYNTLVGERGVRLSGGEQQRIAIARAFLADPRILILDEATSMVDTEAEQIIQEALVELMKGRTVFIIAHRLSTVRSADKIVVIERGEIVEQDHHRALMARNGLYREMVNRQFQLDELWEDEDGFGQEMLE